MEPVTQCSGMGSSFDLHPTMAANVLNLWMSRRSKKQNKYLVIPAKLVAVGEYDLYSKQKINKHENNNNIKHKAKEKEDRGASSFINICILNIFVFFFIHHNLRVEIKKTQSKHKFIDIWFGNKIFDDSETITGRRAARYVVLAESHLRFVDSNICFKQINVFLIYLGWGSIDDRQVDIECDIIADKCSFNLKFGRLSIGTSRHINKIEFHAADRP